MKKERIKHFLEFVSILYMLSLVITILIQKTFYPVYTTSDMKASFIIALVFTLPLSILDVYTYQKTSVQKENFIMKYALTTDEYTEVIGIFPDAIQKRNFLFNLIKLLWKSNYSEEIPKEVSVRLANCNFEMAFDYLIHSTDFLIYVLYALGGRFYLFLDTDTNISLCLKDKNNQIIFEETIENLKFIYENFESKQK